MWRWSPAADRQRASFLMHGGEIGAAVCGRMRPAGVWALRRGRASGATAPRGPTARHHSVAPSEDRENTTSAIRTTALITMTNRSVRIYAYMGSAAAEVAAGAVTLAARHIIRAPRPALPGLSEECAAFSDERSRNRCG